MKHTFFAFLLLLGMTACTSQPGAKLIGNWKIKEIKGMEEVFADMEPEQREAAMQLFNSQLEQNRFEFKQDNEYTTTSPEGNHKGSWQMSEDEKLFTTNEGAGEVDSFQVLDFTDQQISLKMMKSGELPFTMVLERVKE